MYKTLIVALIVLFAGNAAANPSDCELHKINDTHWYFETTQTGLVHGTYNYQAFANDESSDYRVLEFATTTAPDITSYAPESSVSDIRNNWRTFNVSVDQIVNVTWYLNGSSQHTNESVAEASYAFYADNIGVYNVSAVAKKAQDTDMQTWTWTVTGDTTPPEITIDAPTAANPILIAGGGQFYVNFTYTELYPKNYTVSIGNATAIINSVTIASVAGGTDKTINQSLNLNANAADGLYNVMVEMYDSSLNYNIAHQDGSVNKESYDASISQPDNQTKDPGVTATYELTITNTGSLAGTFTLEVINHTSANVAFLNEATIANLAISGSQNVILYVADTSAGTYNVTVKVTDELGNVVAETDYIMTTVLGPILTLGNVASITSDWGRDFCVNHSVTAGTADANSVTLDYSCWLESASWTSITTDSTEWKNHSLSNDTVANTPILVQANATAAKNASETFWINVTRREITITADPISPQSADTGTTFWINGSAEGGYSETFIGVAELIRDGSGIDSKTTTDGNANFDRTETAEGTFTFSIKFYNTTHYNNETTSDATITIGDGTLPDDTPPASITGLNNQTPGQSYIHWTWTDPTDADFAKVMIYLNGIPKTDVSKGAQNYNATELDSDTSYTISTHTVDNSGNINQTWVTDNAKTLQSSQLQRIDVTPDPKTLNIGESQDFTATGWDQYGEERSDLVVTWTSSDEYVGSFTGVSDTATRFTAEHVGVTDITASSSDGTVTSDPVQVTVNAETYNQTVTGKATFTATSDDATATGNFDVEGWLSVTATKNVTDSPEVNPSNPRYGLGSDDTTVSGVIINASETIHKGLAAGNGTIHIQICYDVATLTRLGIDASTLAIWKYNSTTEKWMKQSSTRSGTCIYTDVNHLCLFGLFGSTVSPTPPVSRSSGGGGGPYPPGWFDAPAPIATAKAPATPKTVVPAPPRDEVLPAPTKVKPATTPATKVPMAKAPPADDANQGMPGFTAAFVIAGMLAIVYAMMRRIG